MNQTGNKNPFAPMDKINTSEKNTPFVKLNIDESPGLPNKPSFYKLKLSKEGRGYSDSQAHYIASRKMLLAFDHDDDDVMPQQSQTEGDNKSLTTLSLHMNPKINKEYKDVKSTTIEEEKSVGTKSGLESVCNVALEEKLFQLKISEAQRTMSTPDYFSHKFPPNEEKSGKDDKDKEDSKDSFSFESDTPKYYSPVLAICKNGRDPELATITAQTLVELIDNPKDLNYIIVDCRYEYEYKGGHIKGAINIISKETLEKVFWTERSLLYNKTAVEDMKKDLEPVIQNPRNYKPFEKDTTILNPPIIIFHCEFSQKRGPTAMRALRNKDSHLNAHRFPQLYYPQVFLLEGGYSQFHKEFPNYCDPTNGYVEMYSPDYKQDYSSASSREKILWPKKFSIDIPSFEGSRH